MPYIRNRHGVIVSAPAKLAEKMLKNQPLVPNLENPKGPPAKGGCRLATDAEIEAHHVHAKKSNAKLLKEEKRMQMQQRGMMVLDPSTLLPQTDGSAEREALKEELKAELKAEAEAKAKKDKKKDK